MIQPADHLLTLAEFEELPEDRSRHYELQDGVLIVAPHAGVAHQRMVSALAGAFAEQLPGSWRCLFGIEVVTRPEFPACVRVPDLVVYAEGAVEPDAPRLSADQVLVAVEVVVPGSHATDTVLKPVEYARTGIQHYWVIDLDAPVSLTAYRLVGNDYLRAERAEEVFETTQPFPLKIELTALTSRHVRIERKVDQ